MRLSDFLMGVGRPVSYYPELRRVTGSTNATIFFCQFFYWIGKQKDSDGWIYKTSQEITEETGLSYKEQKSARSQLKKKALLEEKHDRLQHKMYFKINLNSLNDQWAVPESPNGQFGNDPTGSSSITETTTEITTEKGSPLCDDHPEEFVYEEPPQETYKTKKKIFEQKGLEYQAPEMTKAQQTAWDTELVARHLEDEAKKEKGVDVYINRAKAGKHWVAIRRAVLDFGKDKCVEMVDYYLASDKYEKFGADPATIFSGHSINNFLQKSNEKSKSIGEAEEI